MTADASTFVRRPTRVGSALAVAAAVAGVAVVADVAVQRRILAVAAVGVVAGAGGVAVWRRGHPAVGGPLAAVGAAVTLSGVALAATRPALHIHRFELVPGVVGLALLAAGLAPVRIGWERRLVATGSGLVFVAVLAAGLVETTAPSTLLAAGALTVLAWDAGENAVSLGRQVGARASTVRAEVVHVAASAIVAGIGVVLALAVDRIGVDGLPLAALAALLVAAVVLALVYVR